MWFTDATTILATSLEQWYAATRTLNFERKYTATLTNTSIYNYLTTTTIINIAN